MSKNPISSLFQSFAAAEYMSGRLDRRSFMGVLSGAIVAPLLAGPGRAFAQSKSFVMATFGGDNVAKALADYVATPLAKDAGITWQEDPSGPLAGRIRAMVEAGQPIWDVCDSVSFTAIALGKAGLLEPINYDIVDKSRLREDSLLDYGVNYSWYSILPAYDTKAFSQPITSWADVFDVEKFPGKRGFWKYGYCWEGALLADGVAPEDLYPLDIDRAVAKFNSIKEHSVFLDNVPPALLAGEIQIGVDFSSALGRVVREAPDRLAPMWNQGLLGPATFVVPKGNPVGSELAMKFIAKAVERETNAKICNWSNIGPSNDDVDAFLTAEAMAWNPRNPKWAASQIRFNDAYYAENEEMLVGEFLDRVAGG